MDLLLVVAIVAALFVGCTSLESPASDSGTGLSGGDVVLEDVEVGSSDGWEMDVLDAAPDLCRAACGTRECGDDGCGGSCGACPVAAPVCGDDGLCHVECPPSECTVGETRCDGTSEETCEDVCTDVPGCTPCGQWGVRHACEGFEVCLSDLGRCGCEQTVCDVCCDTSDHVCDGAGHCCLPDCEGKECGDDGCGGSCGTCDSGSCVEGHCTVLQDCLWARNQRTQLGCEFLSVDLGVYPDPYVVPIPQDAAHGVLLMNPLEQTATVSLSTTSAGVVYPSTGIVLDPHSFTLAEFPTASLVNTVWSDAVFQILSSTPIAVVQVNPMEFGATVSDTSLLLPTSLGGIEYQILTWPTAPLESLPGLGFPVAARLLRSRQHRGGNHDPGHHDTRRFRRHHRHGRNLRGWG